MDYYAKTTENGEYELFNKENDSFIATFPNDGFLVAWIALQDDYNRKIETVEKLMLCLHGMEVDGEIIDMPNNKLEFDSWYNKLSKLSPQAYYGEIDKMYDKANIVLKSYYNLGRGAKHV